MRTTLDLPDVLFKRIKATAAVKGVKMKDLVTEILERALQVSGEDKPAKRKQVNFPLIRRKKPGTISYTNQELEDLALAEEIAKFGKSPRR